MSDRFKPLNIVHVVESLAIGGLERMVIALAGWQQRSDHSVRIICLFDEGALASAARAQGLQVSATGKTHRLDLPALLRLRRQLQGAPLDVLHTHNPTAHYYTAAATLGLRPCRLINTRHGMGPSQHAQRLEWLYRLAMRRTDVAVAVCHAGRDRFVQLGILPAAKAQVVPNGVHVAGIAERNPAAKARLLAALGRPPERWVLGAVGRFSPVKDLPTLLWALRALQEQGQPVDLVLVGDGPALADLQALCQQLQLQECVHFLGMRDDVAQLLPAFDVFVQSSLSEGYSLALVEASAAALPIVATQVGGNADIVQSGLTGLLVSARNPQAYAQAVMALLQAPELRRQMGQRGRDWALTHGTVQAMGQRYMRVYSADLAADTAPAVALPPVVAPGSGE